MRPNINELRVKIDRLEAPSRLATNLQGSGELAGRLRRIIEYYPIAEPGRRFTLYIPGDGQVYFRMWMDGSKYYYTADDNFVLHPSRVGSITATSALKVIDHATAVWNGILESRLGPAFRRFWDEFHGRSVPTEPVIPTSKELFQLKEQLQAQEIFNRHFGDIEPKVAAKLITTMMDDDALARMLGSFNCVFVDRESGLKAARKILSMIDPALKFEKRKLTDKQKENLKKARAARWKK